MNMREEIFKYAKENFGSDPEFLWEKYPDYAVLRNMQNSKWYALVASISAEKIGLKSRKNVEILNVKCDPVMIGSLIDGKRYFRAYHMNKEHWITLILNGEIPKQEVFAMINLSFEIVKSGKKRAEKKF